MEGTKEERYPAPRGGRRGDQAARPLSPSHLKSGAKRFSLVWKKNSLRGRWPAKWAWASAP